MREENNVRASHFNCIIPFTVRIQPLESGKLFLLHFDDKGIQSSTK